MPQPTKAQFLARLASEGNRLLVSMVDDLYSVCEQAETFLRRHTVRCHCAMCSAMSRADKLEMLADLSATVRVVEVMAGLIANHAPRGGGLLAATRDAEELSLAGSATD